MRWRASSIRGASFAARTAQVLLALAVSLLAAPASHAENFYPLWIEPDEVVGWRGSLSFGGTYADAAVRSYSFSVRGELERISASDRWLNDLWIISGRSDGGTSAALFRLRSRYDRDFRKRWFGFLEGEYRHDRPANIAQRVSVGTGIGYRVAEQRRLSWAVLGGVGYTAEGFFSPLDIIDRPSDRYNRAELLVGTEMEYEISPDVTLNHRLTAYPNLTFGSTYRLTYDATVRAAITRRLGLDISLSWRKSTEPVEDRRMDELLVVTGLALRLD